mmetsp:Transcript_39359/g.109466  ORF Transcript_39359/g.109466 Transcript_39359/m.109466 type:complete len:284 (-) Transcript_39359:149-1000(-)
MRSRAAPRLPWGRAGPWRPLLRAALGMACLCVASLRLPPAFLVGQGAGHSPRGLHSPTRRTFFASPPEQPVATSTEESSALEAVGAGEASGLETAGAGEELTASAPPKVAIADLKVGQTFEGTVLKQMPYGVFVDIGAERAGLMSVDEMSDGFPEKLKKGTKVTARVLNVEAERFDLTRRSGDLARPSRDNPFAGLKDVDLSPFVGLPVDYWFDGEVRTFLVGKGTFIKVQVPGTDKLAGGLLRKEEFGEGMIDSIHFGMKVRVRVLACDTERSRLDFTTKEP